MATLEDIAKKIGTTKGTVSKALNGASDVSESMRKAVLEAAVELGYNRVFRSGSSKRICVFISNMDYEKPEDFGAEIITGFRKAAEPQGYQVDIVPLTTETQKARSYDEYMLLHDYLGAFFLGLTLSDPWMKDFRTCRTPAILYDNRVKNNPRVTCLGVDNEEAMEMAVARLKELGHRKIGYLSGALGSYIYQSRYMAFFHALKQNQLEDHHSQAGNSFYISEILEKHLPRLLKMGCTALLFCNDLLAHTVMVQCQSLGLRVPEDISIIGFDDILLCSYTAPPLSSIRQDRPHLGRSAFYALSCQLNETPISTLYLHGKLIQRDSIGPAPAGRK